MPWSLNEESLGWEEIIKINVFCQARFEYLQMACNTYLFNIKKKAVPFVKASNQKVKSQKLSNTAVTNFNTEVITTSLISSFPIFSQKPSHNQCLLEEVFSRRRDVVSHTWSVGSFILLTFGFIALAHTKYVKSLLWTQTAPVSALNKLVVFVSSWHIQNPETPKSIFTSLLQNYCLLNSTQLILTFINKPEPTDLIRPWNQHWTTGSTTQ